LDLKTRALKWVDGIAGSCAAAVLPAPRRGSCAAPREVLVIRPGGIGDAVLIVPALRALKERFPSARVTVLAERRNAGVFQLTPAVDRLLLYDTPSQLISAVRGGYDTVIDSEQWHRLSAVIARLTRAPLSIGFATNNRQRLFAHRIAYSHEKYEAFSFFDLLKPLGIAPGVLPVPFLSVPAEAARKVAGLIPGKERPFVAIFPGASIAERRWGAARFRELAGRLAGQGLAVVVVGGRDDAAEGAAIVAECGGVNLAGRTSLAETAAVIAGAALLVTGDSGVLHLAVGLGVPTVSLFGPGIQAKWGAQGEGHLVLNRRLSCSPCTRFGTTPPCRIGAKCLSEIAVDEVVCAVATLLQRHSDV
jgi:heptosyltransferase II